MTLLVKNHGAQKVPPHSGLHANNLKARSTGEVHAAFGERGLTHVSDKLKSRPVAPCEGPGCWFRLRMGLVSNIGLYRAQDGETSQGEGHNHAV